MKYHRPYTLYGRRLRNGHHVWYFRIYDSDGHRMAGRSTGTTNKAAAHQVVIRLIQEGRLGLPATEITFENYSTDWWIADRCPYVQSRLMRGRVLTQKYIENQRGVFRQSHFARVQGLETLGNPPLPHRAVASRPSAERHVGFGDQPLPQRTANDAHRSEADAVDLIQPYQRCASGSYTAPSREILTLEEAKALLDESKVSEFWADEMTYCASRLASQTGMRQGEVLALRIEDIHEGYITVAHSWDSRYEGLKPTKTKRVREIPITSQDSQVACEDHCGSSGRVRLFNQWWRASHLLQGHHSLALCGAGTDRHHGG